MGTRVTTIYIRTLLRIVLQPLNAYTVLNASDARLCLCTLSHLPAHTLTAACAHSHSCLCTLSHLPVHALTPACALGHTHQSVEYETNNLNPSDDNNFWHLKESEADFPHVGFGMGGIFFLVLSSSQREKVRLWRTGSIGDCAMWNTALELGQVQRSFQQQCWG